MKCRFCFNKLEHIGDYCLSCGQTNTTLLGLCREGNRAYLLCFYNGEFIGEEVIKMIESSDKNTKERQIANRNSMELISEAIHRKRPDIAIISGFNPKEILRLWSPNAYYTDEFNSADEFRAALEDHLKQKEIEKIEIRPEKKIRGKHTTVIGGRNGFKILMMIGGSPYIKKIIPGPIEVSGKSGVGFQYKIQKPDNKGNLRLLLKDGSAVQELRIVTTAYDENTGEKIAEELKHRLR